MKVRRKSLHRSANAKRAKKFAAMRAAKERLRQERATAPLMCPMCKIHGGGPCLQCDHLNRRRGKTTVDTVRAARPLFVITIRCRDGAVERVRVHEGLHGLHPAATTVGRQIAAVLGNYRPAP